VYERDLDQERLNQTRNSPAPSPQASVTLMPKITTLILLIQKSSLVCFIQLLLPPRQSWPSGGRTSKTRGLRHQKESNTLNSAEAENSPRCLHAVYSLEMEEENNKKREMAVQS
jgi:hypothetical protein